jgi:hypothetical protein
MLAVHWGQPRARAGYDIMGSLLGWWAESCVWGSRFSRDGTSTNTFLLSSYTVPTWPLVVALWDGLVGSFCEMTSKWPYLHLARLTTCTSRSGLRMSFAFTGQLSVWSNIRQEDSSRRSSLLQSETTEMERLGTLSAHDAGWVRIVMRINC